MSSINPYNNPPGRPNILQISRHGCSKTPKLSPPRFPVCAQYKTLYLAMFMPLFLAVSAAHRAGPIIELL